MMVCSKCGNEIKDGEKFCSNCGQPVITEPVGARCAKCGAAMQPGTQFCPNCGSAAVNADAENKNTMYILLAVCSAVVLILAGVLIFFMLSGSRSESRTESEALNSNTSAPIATEIPAPAFTLTDASSTRGTDTEGGQYSTEAVLSEDPMTKWVPATNRGNGIGEWIQISSVETQYVRTIQVLNGYHKSFETWQKNNRVRECTVSFSNGESMNFVLNDTMDMVNIDLGKTVATSSIRLTIRSVYRGTRWDDTAITYLGAK